MLLITDINQKGILTVLLILIAISKGFSPKQMKWLKVFILIILESIQGDQPKCNSSNSSKTNTSTKILAKQIHFCIADQLVYFLTTNNRIQVKPINYSIEALRVFTKTANKIQVKQINYCIEVLPAFIKTANKIQARQTSNNFFTVVQPVSFKTS